MKWENGPIVLSDDSSRLDFDFIESGLRASYWAAERPRDVTEASFRNSLGFGLYDRSAGSRQVGFARAVTDRVTFAWICDVWIDPAYRGRGLSKWLVGCILRHPDVANTRQRLMTRDAHALYEPFGFVRREAMRRFPDGSEPPVY